MICIDQTTGEKTAEPLKTLSRKLNGKIAFGVYLKQTYNTNDCYYINKEDPVIVKWKIHIKLTAVFRFVFTNH